MPCVVLPFALLYLVALAFSDSPAGALTDLYGRRGSGRVHFFGRAALTESASGWFRLQGDKLDHRVAYAQAAAKYWDR
ncbi:hypothetical protein ACFYXD_36620 [Streptomyces platensis]|uniref:hypothetical protein n=1 Tax=Streptomyces platensis TaxID=58346 RepID=UPI0036C90915